MSRICPVTSCTQPICGFQGILCSYHLGFADLVAARECVLMKLKAERMPQGEKRQAYLKQVSIRTELIARNALKASLAGGSK
jgi:hypothetical protein